MRRASIWKGCLGLSLAWGTATASASESAAESSRPAATLGRPMATLGRPVAAPPTELPPPDRPEYPDARVTPAGLSLFSRPRVDATPSQEPEATLPAPRPMPKPTDVWGAPQGSPLGQPIPAGPPAAPTSSFAGAIGDAYPPDGDGVPYLPWFGGVTPPSHFWVNGEYLLWWMRDSRLPPLVTTSPPGSFGILGSPGTQVLFGDGKVNHDERSGGRFSLGWWFDECHDCGLDASFFFLGQRNVGFLASSGGNPLLARPFIDVSTGLETAQLVAALSPPVAGTVRVDFPSRLWGADANLRHNLCRGQCWSLDKLIGFRYLDLHESLTISEFLSPLDRPGQLILVTDRFATRNQFYGGQMGLQYEVRKGKWYLDVTGKVALGSTHQVVHIDGTTTFIAGGITDVQRGGLLAQPTNIGRFSRNQFSVVPEIGVRLGCQLTPHLRAFIGYNFLYWADVARPGEQIDRVINRTQLPSFRIPGQLVGAPRPSFTFRDSDFWAQGISFGLELRY